jgi:hypothetical protein
MAERLQLHRGQMQLAVALSVSAVGAMAAVLLLPTSANPVSLLATHQSTLPFSRAYVRAPGDTGHPGHGIGGQVCWEETNKESGLSEWTCAKPEDTLAGARMLPARRPALFDFGSVAPTRGYAGAYEQPWGDVYNEDNMGALPPMDWGDNWDGKNFVPFYPEEQDMNGETHNTTTNTTRPRTRTRTHTCWYVLYSAFICYCVHSHPHTLKQMHTHTFTQCMDVCVLYFVLPHPRPTARQGTMRIHVHIHTIHV